MNKPKVGKVYIFVRSRGGAIEHTEFTRHEDGSAGFMADGMFYIHECHPNAWQGALESLAELGFHELSEAIEMGLVSSSWSPTPESQSASKGPVKVEAREA